MGCWISAYWVAGFLVYDAVFVGFNAHFELVNVLGMDDSTKKTLEGFAALLAKKSSIEINILRVEASLGIWIGAVTFTGSVIAYGKLAGKVTSAATKLPGGHILNAVAAISSLVCLVWYLNGRTLPLRILTFALFIGSPNNGYPAPACPWLFQC